MPQYAKIKYIHALLPDMVKLDKEMKGDLVQQYTKDHRKRSCADLTDEQADALILHLKTPYRPPGKPTRFHSYAKFDFSNRSHKYILSMCYTIGWVVYSEPKKRNVVDMYALGEWMKKYGYLKKELMKYTEDELPKLVTQVERVLKTITDNTQRV